MLLREDVYPRSSVLSLCLTAGFPGSDLKGLWDVLSPSKGENTYMYGSYGVFVRLGPTSSAQEPSVGTYDSCW